MQHKYYDVAELNARYKRTEFLTPGGGSLGGSSLGCYVPAPGVGDAESESFPWKAFSANTKGVQNRLNPWLKSKGLCTIGSDGKLGPATCGAWKAAYSENANITGGAPPAYTCQSFAAPTRCGGGVVPGSGGGGGPVSPPTTRPPLTYGSSSSSSDALWIGLGVAAAVAAVGYAVYTKKKR
jgi:hypothetical protein